DCTFNDWGIANDNQALALFWQQFQRHLAVGLGTTKVNQHCNTSIAPGSIDRFDNLSDVGSKPTCAITARISERYAVPYHLPDHVGRTFGDLGRMRNNYDSDVHLDAFSRAALTAPIS